MKIKHSIIGVMLGFSALLGAGCGESITPGVSATQYYNDIISQTNTIQRYISDMENSLTNAKDQTNELKKSYYSGRDHINGSMTASARTLTVDRTDKIDIDEETKKQVDDLLRTYYDKTDQTGATFEKLGNYAESEGYKDDNGEQFKTFEKELQTQLDELLVIQSELGDLMKEKQEGIDLGIDENSTDPVEIGILTTDTLTTDTENAQKAALDWLDEYVASGKAGSTDEMRSAFDTLKANYDNYKTKSEGAGVNTLQFSGSSFTTYMVNINDYINSYEVVLRNIENGDFEGIEVSIGDASLINAGNKNLAYIYNEKIVSMHNSLINSFQTDSRLK